MSAAIPVIVIVSTVVVRSGTARRRTDVFCRPSATASTNATADTSRTVHRLGRDSNDDGDRKQHEFGNRGVAEQSTAVRGHPRDHRSATERADDESDQR